MADLPVEARLTFIGLWTHCDDEGRCIDDPRLIKAAIWPLERTSKAIEIDLAHLEKLGRIVRYQVDGRRYLACTTWGEHQRINRPKQSRIPPPPGMHTSLTNHGHDSDESPWERKGKEQGREGKG